MNDNLPDEIRHCDRVRLTMDQAVEIEKWVEKNKHHFTVNDFQISLEELVVELKSEEGTSYFYYKIKQGEYFKYKLYFVKDGQIFLFAHGKADGVPDFREAKVNPIVDEPNVIIAMLTDTYFSLMFYMALCDPLIKTDVRNVGIPKKKKGKKNKRGSKTVKLTRVIYEIEPPSNESLKRAYERQAEAWGVRGHFRKLKSGKTVWVKPHVKGPKGAMPAPKIYTP